MKLLTALTALFAILTVSGAAEAQYGGYYERRGYGDRPYTQQPYGEYRAPRRGGGCGFMITTQATTQGPGAGERARQEAMGRWQNEAAGRFGPAYANFGAARGANASCNRQGGFVYCTVRGIPCAR